MYFCNSTKSGGADSESHTYDAADLNTEGKTYYYADLYGSPLVAADGEGSFKWYAERGIWGNLKERKGTGEDAWGDSLRFTAYPYDPVAGKHFAYARIYDGTLGRMYAKDPVKQGLNGYLYCDNDPADYTDPDGELAQIAVAALGSATIGFVGGFVSSAVSQHMSGEKFSLKKALGTAVESAVVTGVKGAMLSSGFGAAAMFAGDFAAGTAGNMLNRAVSGERQNLGESLWEGTLNAVGNAVFVKDPIGSLKGAGKKPINGFRDVFRRGAEAAGVKTLMNDLAQMSGIVGGRENPDSGSRYSSSTLGRATTGFDRSAINTGGYTGGKQDPRTLCEPSDTFSGGIGSQSTRGYRQTGGNKRKSRFSFGKLVGDVIVNSLLGGFTSTMYYGADRAVGAVSNGIRGRRSSRQRIADNESGRETELFLPDEFYNKDLPKQVAPNIRSLPKYDESGNLKQTKYYDDYGREIGWVDYSDHGYPQNHSAPHWHEVQWNSQYPDGHKINHRLDTNPPF